MGRFLAMAVLASMAMGQLVLAEARIGQKTAPPPVSTTPRTPVAMPGLPPPPPGKSTVIGGAIRDVDPVRDQFILNVFGGGRMKILYDERTQVFQDGRRIPLRDLRADNHASVETVLDGTNIFARSIHTLSRSPQGEYQGQVLKFDPATGDLTVTAGLSGEPIQLRVPAGTSFVRSPAAAAAATSAPPGPSDLVKGSLVSVKFVSGKKGQGVVRQITILATPGSSFVFTGNISFLDLHSRLLVVIDPRDGANYKISFDPARFPVSGKLHEGISVRVTADFDGTRYVATAIQIK